MADPRTAHVAVSSTLTNERLIDEFLAATVDAVSGDTHRRRRATARRFARFLDGRLLLSATVDDVDRWRDSLPHRKLVIAYLATLNAFFTWAVSAGLMACSPVDELHRLDATIRERNRDLIRWQLGRGYLSDYRQHLQRRGLKPNTIERNTHLVRVFDRWLTPYSVLNASHTDIERFLDERRGRSRDGRSVPLDRTTRNQWIGGLSTFYRWAINEDLTAKDPTMRVIRPKMPKHLPRPIADADLRLALKHADTDNHPVHTMLCLGAYTGLRCLEIAAFSVDWLVGDEVLRVRGKGDKDRVVPLHPTVLESLHRLGLPAHGALFVDRHGEAWTARRVSVTIGSFFDDLGIDAGAHQLRHWFGTNTYAATRDLRLVQELMGHSSIQTTAIYTALVPGDDALAAVRSLGVLS